MDLNIQLSLLEALQAVSFSGTAVVIFVIIRRAIDIEKYLDGYWEGQFLSKCGMYCYHMEMAINAGSNGLKGFSSYRVVAPETDQKIASGHDVLVHYDEEPRKYLVFLDTIVLTFRRESHVMSSGNRVEPPGPKNGLSYDYIYKLGISNRFFRPRVNLSIKILDGTIVEGDLWKR